MSLLYVTQASAGILCKWFGLCFGGGSGGGGNTPPAAAPEIDGSGALAVIALLAGVAAIVLRRVNR